MIKTIKIHLLDALVALGYFAWEAQGVLAKWLPWPHVIGGPDERLVPNRINPFGLFNSWLGHRRKELEWLMFEPNGEYSVHAAKFVPDGAPLERKMDVLHKSAKLSFPPGTRYAIHEYEQKADNTNHIISYYGDKAQEHGFGKVLWSGTIPTEHKNRFWPREVCQTLT